MEIFPGRKPAFLVKLVIIWDIGFGHKAVNHSAGEHRSAVEHPAAQAHRQAHNGHDIRVQPRAIQNLPQTCQSGIVQRILKEQVLTGVARQAQLREYQNIHLFRVCFFQNGAVLPGVLKRIPHPHIGNRTSHRNEIQHRVSSIVCFFSSLPQASQKNNGNG